jgi:hypothetical protein
VVFDKAQKSILNKPIYIMQKLHLLLVFVMVFISSCSIEDTPENLPEDEVQFVDGTKLIFVSKEEGAKIMGTSDEYSQALSKFDIASRTYNPANNEEQHYLAFAAAQTQEWEENEITVLKIKILQVKEKIEKLGLKLNFPSEIKLVKSSLQEEGGVISYTRTNYIVMKGDVSEEFIIHELFHILTRFNPEKRDELYKTINFNSSNRISYPDAIKDHIVTNPDAPFLEHTINLTIDGEQKEAVFILYTGKDYESGSFFNQWQQKLMLVEGGANSKTPVLANNAPILLDFSAASDLKDKIGTNTSYTLHPEEILADHFIILVKPEPASDPAFIEAMKTVLTK